jgi:hypothetical protein
VSKKQLIEVALPLEEINRPSSRVHPQRTTSLYPALVVVVEAAAPSHPHHADGELER